MPRGRRQSMGGHGGRIAIIKTVECSGEISLWQRDFQRIMADKSDGSPGFDGRGAHSRGICFFLQLSDRGLANKERETNCEKEEEETKTKRHRLKRRRAAPFSGLPPLAGGTPPWGPCRTPSPLTALSFFFLSAISCCVSLGVEMLSKRL